MENSMYPFTRYSYNEKPKLSLRQNLIMLVLIAALGFLSIILCPNAIAETVVIQDPLPPTANTMYLGAFGGIGYFNNNNIDQTGTVFFNPSQGGTLVVHATGNLDNHHTTGIWGLHAGYEWINLINNERSSLIPAAEIEGYYFRNRVSGHLLNPTPRIPNHTFQDSFSMHGGVFLVNSVWGIQIPNINMIQPYFGGGLGTAVVSLSGADSAQVNPPEPGVNHFNSGTSNSDWTFAAQAKAGLRFNISTHLRLLAEYRLLYLSPTHYTFGSTQYPTHAPTTTWATRFGRMYNNMGIIGIDYSF